MKIPKDIKARQESVNPKKSFLMLAGGGGGKTEQMSRRILKLMPLRLNPESILCITFTKKAASEMRGRVIKYLKLGLIDTPPKEKHLEETWLLAKEAMKHSDLMGWDIINNPGRLQLMTIDSFCLQLINNHPVANKYGSTILPIEDSRPLYTKAATNFINTSSNENSMIRNEFVSYCGNSTERAITYLTELMGNRDQWLPIITNGDLKTNLESNFAALLEVEVERFFDVIDHESYLGICSTLDLMRSNLQGVYPDKHHDIHESHHGSFTEEEHTTVIKLFCNIIMTSDKKQYKTSFDKRTGLTAKNKPEKEVLKNIIAELAPHFKLVKRLANLPSPTLSQDDVDALELIKHSLIHTYAELKVIFKYLNSMDFIEITRCALDITNQETFNEALLHVDNKYTDLLIDEFQDTSTAHHLLIENLVNSWEQTDGRTLFLVGDPKQSLYLFRSAALGLFINVKNNGVANIPMKNLELTVNFRSNKDIVDWVNEVFSQSLPKTDDSNMGAASYSISEPFSDKELPDSINFITEPSFDNAQENGEREAVLVADEVDKLLKTVSCETNAILIRSRSYLKYIDKELKERGINYKGIDLVKLSERQPIIDLINLTKIVLYPQDTISLLGLLRAPFVGVLQTDIFKILQIVEDNHKAFEQSKNNPCLDADFVEITDVNAIELSCPDYDFPDHESYEIDFDDNTPPEINVNDIGHLEATYTEVDINDDELKDVIQDDTIEDLSLAGVLKNINDFEEISSDAKTRITTFIKKLDVHRKHYLKIKFRYIVEELWRETNADSFTGDLQDVDIESYFKLLESVETHKTIKNWDDFETALDKLYVQPHPDADPRVQVMTIHKSKGLEMDNIFIPGMHKPSNNVGNTLISWVELEMGGSPSFLMACKPKHGRDKSSHLQYIKGICREKEVLEMARLLYVGVTRAIKRIYLFSMLNLSSDGETFLKPPETSLMGFIFDAVKHKLRLDHIDENESDEACIEYVDDKTIDLASDIIDNDEDTPIEYNLQRYTLNES